MAPPFPTLLAAIAAVGLAHAIVSHFREKAERRRKREAWMRLNFETWKERD
jgi:hypothetical protein